MRRPEWTAEDEDLLRQAVAHYSREVPLVARASRKDAIGQDRKVYQGQRRKLSVRFYSLLNEVGK